MKKARMSIFAVILLNFLSLGMVCCTEDEPSFLIEDGDGGQEEGTDAAADKNQPEIDFDTERKEGDNACAWDLSYLSLDDVYNLVYQENIPVVVYLYEPGCGICHLYSSIFEEVCQNRKDEGVEFYKIDTSRVPVNFNRWAWPTTCFFFNGVELVCESGLLEEDELDAYVTRFLEWAGDR